MAMLPWIFIKFGITDLLNDTWFMHKFGNNECIKTYYRPIKFLLHGFMTNIFNTFNVIKR